jgi:hypothetical protein
MRTASSLLTLFLLLVFVGGCADADGADSMLAGGSGGDPALSGPLEAPTLDAVIPMAKVLRVQWTQATPCDDIDGERRTDALTFAPAFTVRGTDTDYVDEAANEDQTYTYRVRCMRGDAASDWSNTLSGNPFLE